MKVNGPSGTQQAGKSQSKGKAGAADGTFGSLVTGSAQETAGTGAAQSIAAVDALLSVQAAGDATEKAAQKRMHDRGESILKALDDLRMRLLTGTLTVGDVINIADVVASHRERIMDPRLTGILDEIDLRAQVELAKLRVAMDRQI